MLATSSPSASRTVSASLPPASARLEADLRRVVKEKGLVIWLDADDNYSRFVAKLVERSRVGEFPFPVFRFEGSFLELMLALEKYNNGLHPDKLLIHMPGFNEQSIAETPLYELFKAGTRYRKGLDALIEAACVGLVRPEEGKAFRDKKPILEQADEWLARTWVTEKDRFSIVLSAHSPESVIQSIFTKDSPLRGDLKDPARAAELVDYLTKSVGLPLDWHKFVGAEEGEDADRAPPSERGVGPVRVRDLPFLVASWLMAVEFVSDLATTPVTPELGAVKSREKATVQLCRALVARLRADFPDDYRVLSGQFEDMLLRERQAHQPEVLGSIDTFRFEEGAVRGAALTALAQSEWEAAARYAAQRKPEACFWVRHDKGREHTWELIQLGAAFGKALDNAAKGLAGCASLDEATSRYRRDLCRVDRAHRQFEQQFHRVYSTELEDEVALREARDTLRRVYRKWADCLALDFAKLCENFGPLPSPELRQRNVYEQFVHPLIEGGERVAFFMVDALRFEMVEELERYFEEKKYQISLHARLAELPTVTEIGMNALAPVSQAGRLAPVLKDRALVGFRSGGQFTVAAPAERVRAMETRSLSGAAIDVELSELLDISNDDLKRLLRTKNSSPLVVVRSLELDAAGEKGFHLGTFEQTLGQIRQAVQRLQQHGISHFVLAADHGFLLQDATTQLIEYKDGPKRRHVVSLGPSGMADALEIPLSALDYEGDSGARLVFRRDTAIWKVKEKIAPFVHGGNTLQERVIPVLTLKKTTRPGASIAHYEVVATQLVGQGRRERLELRVRLQKQSIGELSFGGTKKISLALRVLDQVGAVPGALPQVIEVMPPGELRGGNIFVPPGADAATVVFEIEGEVDQKVRIEVYHPDGAESVTPKVVEGWFDMHRNRKLGPPKDGAPRSSRRPPPSESGTEADIAMASQQVAMALADWAEGIEEESFRRVFQLIESQGSLSERDLHQVIGPRMTRVFSRQFDVMRRKVPFEVEIRISNGMKVYVKGEIR